MGSIKINILKVLFWEGGGVSKQEYYAFDNVDNYGRPLSIMYLEAFDSNVCLFSP